MGTRIRGAVLAFAAAALLAGAALLPWWSGPPVRFGQPVEGMSVGVTLLGFEGCRGLGTDSVRCVDYGHLDHNQTWAPSTAFAGAGIVALALAILSVLVLLGQGAAAIKERRGLRRRLALIGGVTAGLAVIAGIVVVATVPDVHGAPRGLGMWFAFAGGAVAIAQGVFAQLPERAPRPRQRQPRGPAPRPYGATPIPSAPPPLDFLALMEGGDGRAAAPEPPAWEQNTLRSPGSSLPGPSAVLGTSMPPPSFLPMGAQRPPMPPPSDLPHPVDPLAQTMVPRTPPGLGMPARPQRPSYPPMVPTSPPGAPTQALHLAPSGSPSTSAPPPTAIPVPNLFGGAAASAGRAEPARGDPARGAPPPRPGRTLPPPIFGRPAPSFGQPSPDRDADARASTDVHAFDDGGDPLGDRTDATAAIPEAADPSDTGPLAEPPAPDDLDGRLDTASDAAETIERRAEAVNARGAPRPLFGDMRPRVATPAVRPPVAAPAEPDDETRPRERDSFTALELPTSLANAATIPAVDLGGPAISRTATPTPRPPPSQSATPPPPPSSGNPASTTPPTGRPASASTPPPPTGRPASASTPPPIGRPGLPPPIGRPSSTSTPPPPPLGRPSSTSTPPPIGRPTSTPPPSATSAPPPAPPAAPGRVVTPIPLSTAAPDLPPPTDNQVSSDGPTPACPQCEAPMTWVDKHLRFFCASCRMYF